MNNYSKIIFILKELIQNFSKKISKGIDNKPKENFIFDMIFGIMVASSCNISNIARSLKEGISLKALVKRLARNLSEFNNDKEDVSTYENVRNKIIFENYQEIVKNKIDENTVFCFDPGDITKKYTTKFENIDMIKDGSTGEIRPGYHMLEVAALTKKEKLPIPVYTSLFSVNEEKFVSMNDECLKAIKYLSNKYGKMGIYALDRGFDDKKYFEEFSNLDLKFVIRMKKIRDITNSESNVTENIKKKANRVKMKFSYNYKDKYGITQTAHAGYMKVKIPGIENRTYYLVVIKNEEYKNDPMMLLTNLEPENDEFTKIVNKVYIRRWKIEEYFRFKKQQFQFEHELVRNLNSIRTLNILLTIIIGFIAMFSDNQDTIQYLTVFKAAESLKDNKDIVLVYYAVERGIIEIFKFDLKAIKNRKERITKNADMQMCFL